MPGTRKIKMPRKGGVESAAWTSGDSDEISMALNPGEESELSAKTLISMLVTAFKNGDLQYLEGSVKAGMLKKATIKEAVRTEIIDKHYDWLATEGSQSELARYGIFTTAELASFKI